MSQSWAMGLNRQDAHMGRFQFFLEWRSRVLGLREGFYFSKRVNKPQTF